MPNYFEANSLIAKTTTSYLSQSNVILGTANRDYVGMFTQQEWVTGQQISIRVPGYPTVETGLDMTGKSQAYQDLVVPYVLTENDILNVPRNYNLFELRTMFNNDKKGFMTRYGKSCALALSQFIDAKAAASLESASQLCIVDDVSKLSNLNSFSSVSAIAAMADIHKFTDNDRMFMCNVKDATDIKNSLQNMLNPNINGKITKAMQLGEISGLDMFKSPDVASHTASKSALKTGLTVKSVTTDANGYATAITIQGFTASDTDVLVANDLLPIPAVKTAVRLGRSNTDYGLVVKVAPDTDGSTTYDADASGDVTIQLAEKLYPTGEHTNVSALPAANDEVQVMPSHRNNYLYTRSGLSAIPLPLGEIHGSDVSKVDFKPGDVPVFSYLQGDLDKFTNNHRTSTMIAIKGFSPYIISVPTAL